MMILVTGGCGYIGSHTVVELLDDNRDVVIVDNFSNSSPNVLDSIKEITDKDFRFYKIDITNENDLEVVFKENKINSVIHFAALKAVGESVEKPLEYYYNNLNSTLVLLKLMKKYNVKNFVFSSSATVYGSPKTLPINEDFPLSTTNPYGASKLIIENILKDICKADSSFNVAILRYFNPVGAHKSGLIGENPNGIPNNLMPYITKVSIGELPFLNVYGNDYDTNDGTGVRDYIHVLDLANGHLKALDKIHTSPGLVIYNLGTGNGYSVLDLVNTYSKVNNVDIPYKIVERRAGDIAKCFADPTKANKELNWSCKYNLEDMCKDSYTFQLNSISNALSVD
ncbi:MAG: UDP-glucose 4-epimerase GalE [Romboutsia timonensis]|uniref:UDP-glucose 4-epimerase GalE n=1 Tax=Romboutsia timonensis TaxID=1776391 RepID=UPI002A762409|nr:UDP-glucose 4-epimerase GalE [Romboutsia timonensis]MDY3002251.1 UDP-glucose 4-epimerase GalE [Romboutsia timonensis]